MLKEFDERAAAYRSGNASYTVRERKFQSRRPLKPSVVSTYLVLPFLIQRIGAKRWNGFVLKMSLGHFHSLRGYSHSSAKMKSHCECSQEKAALREQTRDSISFPKANHSIDLARPSILLLCMVEIRRPDWISLRKVCESGVSISTVDEMDMLFEGFDLCAPNTSTSKTINGNYWWHLAAFFNVAIKQQVRKFEKENGREPNEEEYQELKAWALNNVRGTVQVIN